MGVEGPLHRRSQPVRGQALDGGDAPSGHLSDRDQAGAGLVAIDQHRAGAAIAGVAAALRSRRAQAEAEHVAQPGIGCVRDGDAPAVQSEGDLVAGGRGGVEGAVMQVHAAISTGEGMSCVTARRTSVSAASER